MAKNSVFILITLLTTLICYFILGMSGDIRSEIEKYWLIILPIYLVYFLTSVYVLNERTIQNIPFLWFILAGFLFRIVLVPSDPFLSDDVYRYLWDGKIFGAGINPYKHAPLDIQLSEFKDSLVFPNINFPEIATSYPPVSQFIFWINNLLGGSIFTWKILLLLVEIPLICILLKLTEYFQLNKSRILIYFYNPLLIIETYSSGHLEILGVFFFWIAVLLFFKRHDWGSVTFLAFSIMTKFFPLISGLPFLIQKFFRKSGFLMLILVILLLPFMFSGIVPLPGLFSYINRWEFNGGLYQFITSVLNLIDVKEYNWMMLNFSGHQETFYISHGFYYKLFALLIFIVVSVDQVKKLKTTSTYRSINYIQRSFILTALFLLLTPTLHPWYLIWIIPFLVFIPNISWIIFTLLIQASYFVLKDFSMYSLWKESIWVLLIQYVPFCALLIWEYLDRRKIRGWLVN
jgi:hypothetical protein